MPLSASPTAPTPADPIDAPADAPIPLDQVAEPVASADLVLTSGRRYALEAGSDADRLTIRSRTGDVVLRIEVTDRGPVLSFASADIDIAAARNLRLAAERVDIEAKSDLSMKAGGSLTEHAAGDHHVSARGDARVEAAAVEVQASSNGVGIRAMRAIRLDGEHIGLNDDPEPAPFAWSDLARTEDEHEKGKP